MTPAPGPTMRPADSSAYRKALRGVRRFAGVPLTFGGALRDGAVVLDQLVGVHGNRLRGLRVERGRGLGGAVMTRGHALSLSDYGRSRTITHDYDEFVLGEGIRGLVAVPVAGPRGARGVLYAADRGEAPVDGRSLLALRRTADALAAELALRDEVDRRLELMRTTMDTPSFQDAVWVRRSELAELYSELSSIIGWLGDPELRDRLRRACDRFAELGGPPPESAPAGTTPLLSPREIEVVAEVARGCTNNEAADRLSLKPETVKSYLRSASRKLGVHGRYQLVLAARRRGLITA